MQRRTLTALASCAALLCAGAATASGTTRPHASATVTDGVLTVETGLVRRTWTLTQFQTLEVFDHRVGHAVGLSSTDVKLSVVLSGGKLSVQPLAGGLPTISSSKGTVHVEVPLSLAGVRVATRLIDASTGANGMYVGLRIDAPLVLAGYTVDDVVPATRSSAVAHSFNAGSDWREPDWKPQLSVGDAQLGDWRRDTSLGANQTVTGEWVSSGGLYSVIERDDLPSTVVGTAGPGIFAGVDITRDGIDLGAVEEQGHLSNPGLPTGRQRVVLPGTTLERVYTGVARDPDDEAWGYYRQLQLTRGAGEWSRAVVYNSDSVDHNRISTGSKDDMDLAEVKRQAAVAKKLGVDTFILDDGWQAISGDWCPDSPQCPEPRGLFPARFPDNTFAAVRKAIAPMRLGLWMSAMEFHPAATAFKRNPTWMCNPLGAGGVALTIEGNGDGSSEPGEGVWNPLAVGPDGRMIDYLQRTIDHAITAWGVTYFKFDFLWWMDCIGVQPTDIYSYREAWVSMIDALQRKHPTVTFQTDETNDYRLWPFESIARGPAWFQNGSPLPPALLHNLWINAPFVPSDVIGQSPLSNGRDKYPTSTLALLTLISHPTIKTDVTALTPAQVSTVRTWVDAYHRYQSHFRGVSYPLLSEPSSGKSWTALQIWDRDKQSGLLAAFRQDDRRGSAKVGLKAIDGARYRLRDLVSGKVVQTVTGAQLRAGITVSAASRDVSALLVDRIG